MGCARIPGYCGGMAREVDDLDDALLRVACACGQATGIGPVTWGKLLARGLDAAWLARAEAGALAEAAEVSHPRACGMLDALRVVDLVAERDLMRRHGVRGVVLGDADYPARLAATHDPPAMLWVRGDWNALSWDEWWVAIVGSREATPGGQTIAFDWARALGDASCNVISGGARGIDAAAHRGALVVRAPTVSILGCGLSVCYPPEHGELFQAIVGSGGSILSELPMAAPPLGHHFPRRNRILAALADATLVVEARVRSGAMVTARMACDLGREVCCVPGRPGDVNAEGCLVAVREGWACLARGPDDVLEALRGNLWRSVPAKSLRERVDSTPSPPPRA